MNKKETNELIDYKNNIARLESLVGAELGRIKKVLETFTDTEKELIELRYGLENKKTYNLFEVTNILNEELYSQEKITEFEYHKQELRSYGFVIKFDNWTMEDVRKLEAKTIRKLKEKLSNSCISEEVEEETFNNGVERLEYLVGGNIDEIKKYFDKLILPYEREIVELRYGLADGKEYTLYEVANFLNEKEHSKERLKKFEEDKTYAKQFGINLRLNEWSMKSVNELEIKAIHRLKYCLLNN